MAVVFRLRSRIIGRGGRLAEDLAEQLDPFSRERPTDSSGIHSSGKPIEQRDDEQDQNQDDYDKQLARKSSWPFRP